MAISQDFLEYHRSIGRELKISEKRIRNLIGGKHWASDGEHKESILRKVIAEFCPEIFRIGTGFVCYPAADDEKDKSSTQLDILVTSKSSPTLYKSGELHFVTPECANAIIEVKSCLTTTNDFQSALEKLSIQAKKIRVHNPECWAGLFVYNTKGRDVDEKILRILQAISQEDPLCAINCVCVGNSIFIRFWENGQPNSEYAQEPVWHSYNLTNLAQAYFINNIVTHLSGDYNEHMSNAWFPVEGTKEVNRLNYIRLKGGGVEGF